MVFQLEMLSFLKYFLQGEHIIKFIACRLHIIVRKQSRLIVLSNLCILMIKPSLVLPLPATAHSPFIFIFIIELLIELSTFVKEMLIASVVFALCLIATSKSRRNVSMQSKYQNEIILIIWCMILLVPSQEKNKGLSAILCLIRDKISIPLFYLINWKVSFQLEYLILFYKENLRLCM